MISFYRFVSESDLFAGKSYRFLPKHDAIWIDLHSWSKGKSANLGKGIEFLQRFSRIDTFLERSCRVLQIPTILSFPGLRPADLGHWAARSALRRAASRSAETMHRWRRECRGLATSGLRPDGQGAGPVGLSAGLGDCFVPRMA